MKHRDYQNLVKFLKFFINRPNHLAKFLVDNNLLDKEFLKKLSSVKVSEPEQSDLSSIYFLNINQMNIYFRGILENKNPEELTDDLLKDLERELERCISEERYEDAIRIRDYLKGISTKKN